MMKNSILYFFLLVSTLGFSQQKSPVKVAIDTTSIRIGEQLEYKISVDKIKDIVFPKLENLKGLEVVKENKRQILKNKIVKKYLLTGFDSGAYYIPQQEVLIKNKKYLTDSLLVSVASIAVDTLKQKMFPIKAIESQPFVFDDFKPYLWWALLGLALIALILYLVFRKKKEIVEKEVIPALPPYQEAMEKFHQLDKKLLWQNNQTKKYYSELTNIVRGYIERELQISALESTTEELMEKVIIFDESETVITTKETLKRLKRLLQEADLVKFAKSKPLSDEIQEDRKSAEAIVSDLKQKPIVVENTENEVE